MPFTGALSFQTKSTVFDPGASAFVTYREPSGDLLTFDGTTWTVRAMGAAAGSPPPRTASALGVDEAHGRVVLFGGTCGAAACNDQWVWDGNVWSQVTVTLPLARKNAQLAFKPSISQVVLFGGHDVTQFADTWGWDGSMWTQFATTFPNPVIFQTGGLLTFDTDKDRMLWLNGTREIYLFDGTAWTQTFVDANGPLLGTFGGAYYRTIQAIIVFGGSDSRNVPLAQTWVLNVP